MSSKFIAIILAAAAAVLPVRAQNNIPRAVAVNPGAQQSAQRGSLPNAPVPNAVPLRIGDTVEVHIANVPVEDIQQWAALSYTIDESGNLNMPENLGLIKAAGYSPSQLQQIIQTKLISDGIYTNPTITINLPVNVRWITVSGAVRAPQRIPYATDLTLMSSIGAAGGPSDYAGDKIRLVRGGQVQTFSRKKLTKNPSQDPHVNPGDQIDLVESPF